jgi:hypothetical protein
LLAYKTADVNALLPHKILPIPPHFPVNRIIYSYVHIPTFIASEFSCFPSTVSMTNGSIDLVDLEMDALHRTVTRRREVPPMPVENDKTFEIKDVMINVDSSYRDREAFPDAHSFRVYLMEPLSGVVSCFLSSAEVPYIRYNITASNNKFAWTEEIPSSSGAVPNSVLLQVAVPTGHYTGDSLGAELMRLMNHMTSAPVPDPRFQATALYRSIDPYEVTYMPTFGGFHFRSKKATVSRFKLDFTGLSAGIAPSLGFAEGTSTIWSSGAQQQTALTSTSGARFADDRFVFLSIPELDSQVGLVTGRRDDASSVFESTITSSFARLPLTVTPDNVLRYGVLDDLRTDDTERIWHMPQHA